MNATRLHYSTIAAAAAALSPAAHANIHATAAIWAEGGDCFPEAIPAAILAAYLDQLGEPHPHVFHCILEGQSADALVASMAENVADLLTLHPMPEEMRVARVSEYHLTPEDRELLRRDAESGTASGVMGELNMDCGTLIHFDEIEDLATEWPGYSPAFHSLLGRLHHVGYTYARIDADCTPLPGIPVFA